MTKFNPNNKKTLTYGDVLYPLMKITDQDDANQYLNAYIIYQEKNMDGASNGQTARQICLHNIGYYAGYYDTETQERINRLFNTKHPIFG